MNLKDCLRQLLPSRVRPWRIFRGPLRGSYLVTSWRDYPTGILGHAEPGLIGWFAKRVKPGETWLDLGANYGYTSLALCRHVGKSGRVFAFEPLLTTAGHLASTKAANQLSHLTVVPLAIGDAGELTLVHVRTWKGMAQPVAETPRGAWLEPILCVALDKIWDRLCGPDHTISGIKIDVEGMEREVLRGMTGILRKYKPKLVIEIHQSRGVDLPTVDPILREAGYNPDGCLVDPAPDGDRNYEFVVDQDSPESGSSGQWPEGFLDSRTSLA